MKTTQVFDSTKAAYFNIAQDKGDARLMIAQTVPTLREMETRLAKIRSDLKALEEQHAYAATIVRVTMNGHSFGEMVVGETLVRSQGGSLMLTPIAVVTNDGQAVADIVSAHVNAANLRFDRPEFNLPPLARRAA